MDVQILLDAYGAAVYTASYLTKHEKNRLAPRILYQLSKNARNRTVKQMVRTVLLSVLNTREVSIQEVLWIRTGKKLCDSSRSFIALPSLHCSLGTRGTPESERRVILSPDGTVAHSSTNSDFYSQRPRDLEDLSLFEFISQFQISKVVSPLLKLVAEGSSRYAARRRVPAIVQIRAGIDPTEPEIFAKAMLYLYVPWRSVEAILLPGVTAKEVLAARITSPVDAPESSHLSKVITHYEGLMDQESRMRDLRALDALRTEREEGTWDLESDEEGSAGADNGAENERGPLENLTDAIDMDRGLDTELSSLPGLERSPIPGTRISKARHSGTDQAVRALRLTNKILAKKGHTDEDDQCPSGDGLGPAEADPTARQCHRIASFNCEQCKVYDSIKTDLEGGTQSKVLVIVGPGGTGKSYLIDTVAMYLEISGENAIKDAPEATIHRRHKKLVKMAFTGVAAANVGGLMIHTALEVNSKEITSEIPEKTLARLQKDWNDVTVLVIDDVSFLSPAQLFAIRARLGTIFPSTRHLPLAGLYVILAGDTFQLGPIGGKTLRPRDGERPLSVQERIGRDYYLDCDKFYELKIGQRNFGPFYDTLSRLRVGATTQEDVTTLNTRVVDPYGPVAAKSFEDAVVVVGTNREAISCNEQNLQSACAAPSVDGQMKRTVRVWSHVRLSKRSRNGR